MPKKLSKLQQEKDRIAKLTGKPELVKGITNIRDLVHLSGIVVANPKTYVEGGGTRLVKS
jgi:hypothetical protein|tara:strand:+ start:2089 stop:2268 length:180 start_codon:yes stop_codon:yes gene_type:complete